MASKEVATGNRSISEKRLVWVIRLSLILTLGVIVLGAYTRLSDAGLGCPDWPGCYGQLAVPTSEAEISRANALFPERKVEQSKAWAEMIHRYFAGSLGLVVFAITLMSLKNENAGRVLPLALSLVVVGQALLGMWTVTMKLMPVIVLAHLFGGFTLLSLLLLLYTRLQSGQAPQNHPMTVRKTSDINFVRAAAMAALLLVIGQIFLGGWTSANYAALMCTSLPVCQGDWMNQLDFRTAFSLLQTGHDNYEFGVLDYSGRMTIHVSHRIGAMIVTLAVLLLSWKLYVTGVLRRQSYLLAGLLLIQIALGVFNVTYQLPLSSAVLHNLFAALLLIALVRVNYLLHLMNREKPVAVSNRDFRGTYE